ncbi:MAG: DUF4878 domain-containing protein [Parabacteroides gordonii]|nr:DUF4878 domain-containing protein [Parabacteroides gordonii]
MKLTTFTFIFSLLTIMLAGCSENNNTPEAVATNFTKYLYTAKFDKTKKLCTEKAQEMMDMFPEMMAEYIPMMKKSSPQIEVTSCDIDDSSTNATVQLKVKNGLNLMKGKIDADSDQNVNVYLQKEADKWLVYRFK